MAQGTIILKGAPIRKEVACTVIVRPGALVTFAGAPATTGATRKAFAVENDIVGRGIEVSYAVGEIIQYVVCAPGDEIYAFLATGNNAAVGAALSAGATTGALKLLGADPLIAYATEALNNVSGVDQRLRVEVA